MDGLTAREMEIYTLLKEAMPYWVLASTISMATVGVSDYCSSRVVARHISRLRTKLGYGVIETAVRGGYRLAHEVPVERKVIKERSHD